MVSKFLLVSILDVLLGINFLSPVSLIYDALEESPSGYSDPRAQSTPYLLPDSETSYFPIRNWEVSDPDLTLRSAIVYDIASDKILFGLDPDSKMPIASLTKLMTAVAVIENMDLEDAIMIKNSAIERSKSEGGGSNLYAGEKIKAADLLKLMLIKSSNDAAYAFEEYLAENYGVNLTEKMNEKAAALEMADTFFTEPAGLDDLKSFSTGNDLVKLVKYSFKYGNLYEILKTQEAEIASIDGRLKHQIFNTNELLGRLFNIIGGKTGFTELSGGSMILVTQAPKGESRIITIVLGSSDRFGDAENLVKWAGKAYLWK